MIFFFSSELAFKYMYRPKQFGYQHSSKYILLCSAKERVSYKFKMW